MAGPISESRYRRQTSTLKFTYFHTFLHKYTIKFISRIITCSFKLLKNPAQKTWAYKAMFGYIG